MPEHKHCHVFDGQKGATQPGICACGDVIIGRNSLPTRYNRRTDRANGKARRDSIWNTIQATFRAEEAIWEPRD